VIVVGGIAVVVGEGAADAVEVAVAAVLEARMCTGIGTVAVVVVVDIAAGIRGPASPSKG